MRVPLPSLINPKCCALGENKQKAQTIDEMMRGQNVTLVRAEWEEKVEEVLLNLQVKYMHFLLPFLSSTRILNVHQRVW